MTDLLERLRRDDPSALEELGHDLLPWVQAAVLAQDLTARDPIALLQAFREAVAAARASPDATAFSAAVVEALRARAPSLPPLAADAPQAAALARIAALAPLAMTERELVLARFVERMPADLTTARFGLDAAALAAILARGATLLVGPAPGEGDWAREASLLDPNAAPAPAFIELENVLTCLSIDVTAFELNPVMVQVPVPRPGFQPSVPQEAYPSVVKTQGAVDLPAEVSHFIAPRQPDEATQPVATPLAPPAPLPPPVAEPTETHGKPLVAVDAEATVPRARPLPAPDPEATETRGKPLIAVDPDATAARARPLETVVALRPVPAHRRIPGRWWWGASALCAILGTGLYLGLVSSVQQRVQRPWAMVPVVSAAYDLTEGTRLTLEMLATRAVPAANVTPSVLTPGSVEYAIGQKLEFPLQAGDPVLWSHFDAARKTRRFDVVTRGRAFSTVVTERKALGGMLRPNEEVDLLLTVFPLVRQEREPQAVTLLQKVRVLAVGPVTTQTLGTRQVRYNDVTFLLVPEEVEVLSLARRSGQITASLRAPDDLDTIPRGNTNTQTLLSGVRLKAIEQKRAAVISIIRDLRH